MSAYDPEYEAMRRSRIKRVKRILRHMPRKATLHKYPFIKFFAKSARNRPYLWSFRVNEAVPALYAGFILTFLPLQGVQIPIAFCLALIFRANLMILVALQLISNPLTLVPLYLTAYYIGGEVIGFIGDYSYAPKAMEDTYRASTGLVLGAQGKTTAVMIFKAMVGGAIMGIISGFISSIIYRQAAKTYIKRHPEKKRPKKIREPRDP